MKLADLPFKWPPAWIDKVRHDKAGVRFAINVFIASTIVWYVLQHLADTNPIWSIASMVAASEPQVTDAVKMFRSRIINVTIGGVVGLLFLMAGNPGEWKLPLALAVAVFVSSYIIHVQTMWRQAPITAAIVIAAGLESHSQLSGIEEGLHKVAEVIFGCLVGVLVSWSMSKIWPLPVAHAGAGKTG